METKPKRKPVNYNSESDGASINAFNTSIDNISISSDTKDTTRTDAFIARISRADSISSKRPLISNDYKRVVSQQPTALPNKQALETLTNNHMNSSTSSNNKQLSRSCDKDSKILLLKSKLEAFTQKIALLENQLECHGITPVTKGGCLNPEKKPESKLTKTDKKIAEIEAITREIKKCLGICPEKMNMSPVEREVDSIRLVTRVPLIETTPANSIIKNQNLKVQSNVKVEGTVPDETCSIRPINSFVECKSKENVEELTSDQLMSIMDNFGF